MTAALTRREVLVSGACIAGVAAINPQLAHAAANTYLSCVVGDARRSESAAFVAGVANHTRRHLDIADDLCRHWYRGLSNAIVAERGMIAGLTTWMDFEVMRGLAREAGLQLQFRGDHIPLADGMEHQLSIDAGALAALQDARAPWPTALGMWLTHNAQGLTCDMELQCRGTTAAISAQNARLVSWLFA